ncbi:glycosyltransferase family 2 protein [Leucobacter chironomi]|uniref:glycosyltransferase family 2 protein n=1 Tax=Leucobacter chironomi TaxID=491918 RepID=UPI00046287E9|nr:glycosyltransferase [Leucobacter chironomi]
MAEPLVDVVIPVHSSTRPIARAATSVLDHSKAEVRVNVVAHNIDPEIIRANLGSVADDPRLRLLHLADGIPSPAGPMNLGLDEATAPYVSLLGSDDEFAPGAVDSWLAIAQETGASTVIARIDRDLTGVEPMPPTRRGRTRDLDPVKDRLAYRCAPLGLISRERFRELRFTPGLGSGEDLEFTAALWFQGEHIAYDRTGPAYVGHEDGHDRVTGAKRTVAEDFSFFTVITSAPWFAGLSTRQRTALGVKTLRLHFFDAVFARLDTPEGFAAHRQPLVDVLHAVESAAPGSIRLLSRADRAVIDEVLGSAPDTAHILTLLGARWGGGVEAVLPRNPLLALHPQAPFRTLRSTRP